MERIEAPPAPELKAHIDALRRLLRQPIELLHNLFEPGTPICVARAPGRLDVMGGIADYSGSLVLELPIREAALAAVQFTPEPSAVAVSFANDSHENARRVTLDSSRWTALLKSDYAAIHRALCESADAAWAAYVLGPILVLLREHAPHSKHGVRVLIDSRVPEGKGVSSSAAMEVAAMQAGAALLGVQIGGEEIARLCQVAENWIVGAPCGVMDQMTSALGRENRLLALRCQPAVVEGHLPIPAGIAFWGIDSGIRHAVSGSDYTSVRTGAFMGYRIIADLAGLNATTTADRSGVVEVDDPFWKGYLANITPEEFRSRFGARLPAEMSGLDFLAAYDGTTDRVTRVEPLRTYAICQPTLHPIEENARVGRFRELLQSKIHGNSLHEMGELMYASHASYSACGLGSDGTDLLVKLVRETGRDSGLYGAKITGGGSGGTVAILGRPEVGPAVEQISRRYTEVSGRAAYVFRGSSPGACASGTVTFTLNGPQRWFKA